MLAFIEQADLCTYKTEVESEWHIDLAWSSASNLRCDIEHFGTLRHRPTYCRFSIQRTEVRFEQRVDAGHERCCRLLVRSTHISQDSRVIEICKDTG